MRLNKFVALATGTSRREADEMIEAGRIQINGQVAKLGQPVADSDTVALDGNTITAQSFVYVLLDKPVGYVSSRKQQDDKPTLYSLLPEEYQSLKPAGRLDADSSGLMLLTNDGDLAHQMMHPSKNKTKTYEVRLNKNLSDTDINKLSKGVSLDDGVSALKVEYIDGSNYRVSMHEGRNRQIRRTFAAMGFDVLLLHRTSFGPFTIDLLGGERYRVLDADFVRSL